MYSDPKIIISNNKINIINFSNIDHFSEDKIIIKLDNSYIVISGSNLTISKLVIDEVLINGDFNKIEFR